MVAIDDRWCLGYLSVGVVLGECRATALGRLYLGRIDNWWGVSYQLGHFWWRLGDFALSVPIVVGNQWGGLLGNSVGVAFAGIFTDWVLTFRRDCPVTLSNGLAVSLYGHRDSRMFISASRSPMGYALDYQKPIIDTSSKAV